LRLSAPVRGAALFSDFFSACEPYTGYKSEGGFAVFANVAFVPPPAA
jgi:hypothetical protein